MNKRCMMDYFGFFFFFCLESSSWNDESHHVIFFFFYPVLTQESKLFCRLQERSLRSPFINIYVHINLWQQLFDLLSMNHT